MRFSRGLSLFSALKLIFIAPCITYIQRDFIGRFAYGYASNVPEVLLHADRFFSLDRQRLWSTIIVMASQTGAQCHSATMFNDVITLSVYHYASDMHARRLTQTNSAVLK